MKRSLYALLAILCLTVFSQTVRAEILGDFLSHTACTECHEEIAAGWKTTPHAHAFETLKEQGEEKQSIPECFKCHVVGFEQDGGYIDMTLTPELADVQCESCHGPGRRHVESDGDPDELLQQPSESLCRTCHTEGQDKNFDYALKKRFVHGGSDTKETVAAKQRQGDGSRLVADNRRISFGNMVEGEVAKKVVVLRNTGGLPLKITNVTTS
jgi:hypothetical protein